MTDHPELTGPGPIVFVSFVHEDESVAWALKHYISKSLQIPGGVFLSSDGSQIFAGDRWIDKIVTALSGASVVVLLLTQRSVRRPWVNFEAGGAWLTNKTIIPVCAGNLKAGALPKPYSTLQALEVPSQAPYLLTSLRHHLNLKVELPMLPNQKMLVDMLSGKSEEMMNAERIGDPYWMLVEACEKFRDEP